MNDNINTFHIVTFGCQMNKLDSELIAGRLTAQGLTAVDDPASADVLIVNTCSVRRRAEEKVYSWLGQFKPENRTGGKPIVVGLVGCMAQNENQEIFRRLPFVNFICGPGELDKAADYISNLSSQISNQFSNLKSQISNPKSQIQNPKFLNLDRVQWLDRDVTGRPDRFRAFVSVGRGCNNFCSYCIVPYTRGRETSRQVDDIIKECRRLVEDGVVEITLLGQNVNSYGKDLSAANRFSDLLYKVDAIPGLERLRFVTSHPKDLADDLIQAMSACRTVCENLHLPPQSGCDLILKSMNRGYTRSHYLELIDRLRAGVPGITVAGDFIVGFPGETEADFLDTCDLLQRVRFKNAFIFKYSPRKGTKSADLPNDVPLAEKERRNHELLKIQEAIQAEDNRKLIGRTVEVLVEGPSKRKSRYTGRTRTDYIVHFEGQEKLVGKLVNVELTGCSPLSFIGTTRP